MLPLRSELFAKRIRRTRKPWPVLWPMFFKRSGPEKIHLTGFHYIHSPFSLRDIVSGTFSHAGCATGSKQSRDLAVGIVEIGAGRWTTGPAEGAQRFSINGADT